jgi:hypothetical protein
MAVHPCNPIIQKIKAGGLQIHGQFWLYSKHKASLSYIVRQCLKKQRNNQPKATQYEDMSKGYR